MGLFLALIMGLLGGPALAWATTQPGSLKAFEARKEKFRKGEGKDPEGDFIGPHKPFKHNALIFGLVFGAIGLVVGSMV
jgi:hypothetical protein